MGESFRSIWTHNGRWLASINVDHAQHTANCYSPDPGNVHIPQKIKGPCVASSGDRKRPWDRDPTARMCRGGSCAKVEGVGGAIYTKIQYI